jgi:hypothetical protein
MEMLGLGAGAGVGVDLEADAYDLEVDATALMDRMDGADLRIALSEADMVMRLYRVDTVGHYQKDKISYRNFDSVNRV